MDGEYVERKSPPPAAPACAAVICAVIAQAFCSSRKIPDMTTPTIAPADFIAGMAKGMAVLESFDTERQRLNATLAAERAGITRAAARRHLLTLAYLGYLESDGQYFWLSPKVLCFSGSYLASARLPRVVQPTLNRLAAQTLLPFSVVVLEGPQVVIVARSTAHAEGERILAYGLHLGSLFVSAKLACHADSDGGRTYFTDRHFCRTLVIWLFYQHAHALCHGFGDWYRGR